MHCSVWSGSVCFLNQSLWCLRASLVTCQKPEGSIQFIGTFTWTDNLPFWKPERSNIAKLLCPLQRLLSTEYSAVFIVRWQLFHIAFFIWFLKSNSIPCEKSLGSSYLWFFLQNWIWVLGPDSVSLPGLVLVFGRSWAENIQGTHMPTTGSSFLPGPSACSHQLVQPSSAH